MADTDNTIPEPPTGQSEIRALARRLKARADSVLMKDQPQQQFDLRLAAQSLEYLADLMTKLAGPRT